MRPLVQIRYKIRVVIEDREFGMNLSNPGETKNTVLYNAHFDISLIFQMWYSNLVPIYLSYPPE